MKLPIAVGIVGCGYWGPNLARIFSGSAQAHLTALCDPAIERRRHMQGLHPQVAVFDNFCAMLANRDLDAIVIATPAKTHFAIAKASLLAGKHVLVEKPMASTSRECKELIEIARERSLILMAGHTYLYSEAVAKIAEIVASGDLGEIRYINCQRLNLGLFQQDINVAWDLAPHDFSVILKIMGEPPVTVNCQGNAHIHPRIEDVTNISLAFGGKRFATIQSSWLEPRKVRQMTFVGTRKMIVYDDLQPLEKIRIYDVRVDCPPYYDSFADFHCSYHYGDCYIPRLKQGEPLVNMCRHFLECIAGETAPLSGGAAGLEVVRLLEACDASLRSHGAPVDFPASGIIPLRSNQQLLTVAG